MRHRVLPLPLALVLPRTASAYDFGFVRAPDWMDPIVLGLIALFLVTWGAAIAAKPAGVPVNEMYRTEMPPLPTWLWRIALAAFTVLMAAVFVGMGLARM